MGSKIDFSGKKTPKLYDLFIFHFVYIHPKDKETVYLHITD